jgi:isoquinoline 1-oxidoreductase alpha subunit
MSLSQRFDLRNNAASPAGDTKKPFAHRECVNVKTLRRRPMVAVTVNGQQHEVDAAPDTPLLWVLREHLKLTGEAVRSCSMPVSLVVGKSVITIEGLSADGSHPLQKAWIAEQVPQCGYCQSGQIMQAATLLATNKNPTRDDIVEHMDGNICRCGTYLKIISAITRAAREG